MDTSRSQDRALALGALAALGAANAIPPHASWALRAAPVAASLVLTVIALRRPGPAGAVVLLSSTVAAAAQSGLLWQLAMALGLVVSWLASRAVPALGAVAFARGRVPVLGTLACAAVTPIALAGWVVLLEPDISNLTQAVPRAPLPVLVLGGVAFALTNALLEECIWRGVFQERASLLFSPAAAIAIQALSFGVAHTHGFPRGWVGILLAGTWAAMLGVLRARAGGLLAPVLAHIVADATIATIVLLRAP